MGTQTFAALAAGVTLALILGLMALLSWIDQQIQKVYSEQPHE